VYEKSTTQEYEYECELELRIGLDLFGFIQSKPNQMVWFGLDEKNFEKIGLVWFGFLLFLRIWFGLVWIILISYLLVWFGLDNQKRRSNSSLVHMLLR